MTYIPTTIKSIQRGTITIPAGVTSASVSVSPVNINTSSVAHLGSTETNGGAIDGFNGVYLSAANQVTAFRWNIGGILTVGWQLTEYVPNFVSRVQRGILPTDFAASNAIAVSAVNPARTQLLHLGNSTSDPASGNSSNWLTRLELTSPTVLTCTVGSPVGGTRTSWELVEFK